MSYNNIEFEITQGVAVLTLNRPESLNSFNTRSEEHTSELQSHHDLVCRLLLEKKNKKKKKKNINLQTSIQGANDKTQHDTAT